ncbi:hypothetical protein CBS101457_000145 [Exobasidium rhododendri]|nr:hypothetical protein CBS101457_000145 [Exobasidium rhododendri]
MDGWDHDAYRLYCDPQAATPRVGRHPSTHVPVAEPQTARLGNAGPSPFPSSSRNRSQMGRQSSTSLREDYAAAGTSSGGAQTPAPIQTSIYGGFQDDGQYFTHNPYDGMAASRPPSPGSNMNVNESGHAYAHSSYQTGHRNPSDQGYNYQHNYSEAYPSSNVDYSLPSHGDQPQSFNVDQGFYDMQPYSNDGDLSSVVRGFHRGSGAGSHPRNVGGTGSFDVGDSSLYNQYQQDPFPDYSAHGPIIPQQQTFDHTSHQDLDFSTASQLEAPLVIDGAGDDNDDNDTYKKGKYAGRKKGLYVSSNQQEKAEMLTALHLRTGLLMYNIAIKLRRTLTPQLKSALLSKDETSIQWAKTILFPIEPRILNGLKEQKWMANMTIAQSRVVVQKMSRLVNRDEEHVRYYFLKSQLDEAVAWKIFYTPDDQCSQFIYPLGLDNVKDKAITSHNRKISAQVIDVWPWMKELEGKYFDAVIAKVAATNGKSLRECADLLRQPQVKSMLGRQILRASPKELQDIMVEYRLY